MDISQLNELKIHTTIFKSDNNREINIHKLLNSVPVGNELLYPNILFFSYGDNKVYNPINETIMSLKSVAHNRIIDLKIENIKYEIIEESPMFFFIYNTDNYYHFIYDTLPYLITFNELRKTIPSLKLLMSYPNQDKTEFYKFVTEFLTILNIKKDDIKIVKASTLYKTIYVSTSYTHGFDSNWPPRQEIYDFYQQITQTVVNNNHNVKMPNNIYVSRRSWIHGDITNIGTNYTTRRKMINEDSLINLLSKNGYVEIFTETLSTTDKILLFANAKNVIGPIGGGLCNVLFSNINCNLTAIVSPCFLNVNKRFLYSFANVKTTLFNDVKHSETTKLKSYMRVGVNNIIGEVTKIYDNTVEISYSESLIAGWNNDVKYKTKIVNIDDCVILDDGLNSPWELDINKFNEQILNTK